MAILVSLISIYAFMRVSVVIEQARGTEVLWGCFAIWIKSIILTQAILVVGGLCLFMLRKPKGSV